MSHLVPFPVLCHFQTRFEVITPHPEEILSFIHTLIGTNTDTHTHTHSTYKVILGDIFKCLKCFITTGVVLHAYTHPGQPDYRSLAS